MSKPAFLLAAISAWGLSAAPSQPSADEIVRRSVQVIEADWSKAPKYSFVERDVEAKKHGPPIVKTYEVLMIEDSPYNRVIAINDRPLSTGERAEEDQKLRAEIDRRQSESQRDRSRRLAKYLKERNQDHAMLVGMVQAFDFKVVGEENVAGHDCWVLDANPKPGYQPKTREGKVLTGMRGRLWVEKTQYQWVQVRAEVFKPVSLYGFFAKVGPGTKFMLEQAPVAGGVWLPKHFSVQVRASALGFINEDSSSDETYRDYKPMSLTAATLGATK